MSKKNIFKSLKKLAIIKGKEITSERITYYTEILSRYDYYEVEIAITKCLLELKFFPDISEILERLDEKTPNDTAEEILEKIMNAIKKFGYIDSIGAKKEIGDFAWSVVDAVGGWTVLCNTPIDQIGMMRAQIRKMAFSKKNVLQLHKRCGALSTETPQFEAQEPKGIHTVGESLKTLKNPV